MSAPRPVGRATVIAVLVALASFWLALLAALALGPAGSAVRSLPAMLGMFGPRTWLVLLENPAEARGTGGLVGGYFVVRVDHARFSVLASGTSADLARQSIPIAGIDPGQIGFWGPILTQWNGFNVTPDFPVAASLASAGMLAMGVDVDGVIAVDPFAVATAMQSIGPVTAAGRTVSAQTVARYFLIHEYLDFTQGRDRDRAGMSLAQAIVDRLIANPWAVVATLPRLPSLIDGGHLRIWSSRADEQSWLATSTLGGAIPTKPGPSTVVAFNNAAGNKADAFVRTSIDYTVNNCEHTNEAASRLTIDARNDMPLGLPDKDYGRRDQPDAPTASTSLLVHVFAPVGATDPNVTINGQAASMALETLGNRPVWWTTLELPRGLPVTLAIRFHEPRVPGAEPMVGVTPMVLPTEITTTRASECS